MPPTEPEKDIYDRVSIVSLDDILPQQSNANSHTQRGMGMLEYSISSLGWSGAGEMAANGEIYHGSARREVSEALFNGDSAGKAIVLEHDGTMPVYLKRTDIPTAEDPKAVQLAIANNRVAEVNLKWEPVALIKMNNDGLIDIDEYWLPDEQAELLDLNGAGNGGDDGDQEEPPDPFPPIANKNIPAITLTDEQQFTWNEIKEQLGYARDTPAFVELMARWMAMQEE